MRTKCKRLSEMLIIMVCCLNIGFAEVSLHKDNSAISSKSLDDVRERLETPFMKGLLTRTYQSVVQRIQPNGYMPESLTGAYPGMFPRVGAGSMGQLLIVTGELDKLQSMLNFTLEVMRDNDMERIAHVVLPGGPTQNTPVLGKDDLGCLGKDTLLKLTDKSGVAEDFIGRNKPLKALEFCVCDFIPGEAIFTEIYDSQGVRQAFARRCFDKAIGSSWVRLEFSSPVKLVAGEKYRVVLYAEKGGRFSFVFGTATPKGKKFSAIKIDNGRHVNTNLSLAMVFDYGSLKYKQETLPHRILCDADQIDAQAQIITTWAILALHRGETEFENKTYPVMAKLMDRSTTEPYLIPAAWRIGIGLVCNVALEHSREIQMWHAYDFSAQAFMCAALENMIEVARRRQDTKSVNRWSHRLNKLTHNIMLNMTRDFEGKKIFYEMILPTGREPEPFLGLSYLNLTPTAIGWKGVDKEVYKNTIDTWHRVARIEWDGPQVTSSLWGPEGYNRDIRDTVIGKVLGQDMVYCLRAGEYDRVCDMLDFTEKINSTELIAEAFNYDSNSGKWTLQDPGNGEQAVWWCWAMVTLRREVGLTPLP